MSVPRIVVTGASGFVGRHLIDHLKDGYRIVGIARQIPDYLTMTLRFGCDQAHETFDELSLRRQDFGLASVESRFTDSRIAAAE
jgi:nucleoside-diphosphate-sugar epimerase